MADLGQAVVLNGLIIVVFGVNFRVMLRVGDACRLPIEATAGPILHIVAAVEDRPEHSSFDGGLVDNDAVLLVVAREGCHGNDGVDPDG